MLRLVRFDVIDSTDRHNAEPSMTTADSAMNRLIESGVHHYEPLSCGTIFSSIAQAHQIYRDEQ
jgi:hypothetical protein